VRAEDSGRLVLALLLLLQGRGSRALSEDAHALSPVSTGPWGYGMSLSPALRSLLAAR